MSDAKKLHRLLRSLLGAAASLLIIVSAAFAGNALAPASPATVVPLSLADNDPGDVEEVRDVNGPEPEAPDVDDDDATEVDAPEGIPSAEQVAEDSKAQEEDDQGQDEDADETNDVDSGQDEDQDDVDEAEDDDVDEADEADDDDDDADADDESDDSGEDDD